MPANLVLAGIIRRHTIQTTPSIDFWCVEPCPKNIELRYTPALDRLVNTAKALLEDFNRVAYDLDRKVEKLLTKLTDAVEVVVSKSRNCEHGFTYDEDEGYTTDGELYGWSEWHSYVDCEAPNNITVSVEAGRYEEPIIRITKWFDRRRKRVVVTVVWDPESDDVDVGLVLDRCGNEVNEEKLDKIYEEMQATLTHLRNEALALVATAARTDPENLIRTAKIIRNDE